MAKQVDQRVVEMRFDSKQFEKGAQTVLSTLDRLKQGLNFKGAVKGIDNISSAVKKVDLSGMDKGIQTVATRFSSLQVVGVTALANITNSAVNAGKNIVKALTIDPLKTGFQEYETQINAIQTIMANTSSKGTTLDQVNAALDELNTYADQTIYNFTEMTRNIGTFTAAGVDLDTAVSSIKGIANLAAVSGSTSQQASTAMYQLSQAIAAGKVQLMDWNSVVNAGMGGEVFQNALKRTAQHFGYNVDEMIAKYGSFRESLTQGGWLTTEVLTETLTQLSGAYTEADLIAQGYTEQQAKDIVSLANTAVSAATDVKTFTQLMDTLRESLQSGWAQTWELIFGDFEEAKAFFSDLSDYLGEIIQQSSDARNNLLEGALSQSPWDKLKDSVSSTGITVDRFQSGLIDTARQHGIAIDEMIEKNGSFEKSLDEGWLSKDIVSETLNSIVESGTEAGATIEELSDEQLKNAGYSEEQVVALRNLAKETRLYGTDVDKLIRNMSATTGRELFTDTLINTLKAIIEPIRAIGNAFNSVFSISSDQLYRMIDALHSFSEAIVMDPESLDKLTRTFKGLFGIVKIFTSFIGGVFGVAFRGLTAILDNFNLHILDITSVIGDVVYAFSDWISSGQIFYDIINTIVAILGVSSAKIQGFFDAFANIEIVQNATNAIKEFGENFLGYFQELSRMDPGDILDKIARDVRSFVKNVRNYFSNLSWDTIIEGLSNFGDKAREMIDNLIENFKEVGPNIIEGLQNGLTENTEKIYQFFTEIGQKIIEAIKAVLGIHSPSTVMYEIGQNIVQGLINGITSMIDGVAGLFGGLGDQIKGVLNGIDWGSVGMVVLTGGIFVTLYKLSDAFQIFATAASNVTKPMASAGKVLDSIAYGIDTITGREGGSTKLQNMAIAVKTFATAIAILAASVAVLSQIDAGQLFTAVGAIAALAVIIGVLAAALNKFSDGASTIQSMKLNVLLISLAGSFLLLSVAAKIISTIDTEGLVKAGAALVVFGGVVAGLIAVTKLGKDVDKAPAFLGKLAVSFVLLAVAAKLVATMELEDMGKAAIGLAGLSAVVIGLIAATKLAGKDIDKVPAFLGKLSVSFLLLAVAAKLIATISWDDMKKAGVGLAGLTALIVGLMAATKLIGKGKVSAIGTTLMQVSIAMTSLTIAAKLLASMSFEEMGKAAIGLAGLTAIIAALVAITNLAPKEQIAKISLTLLTMSLAIGVLAGVSVLLGMVKTENLVKGIVAVSALSALVSLMVVATKKAKDVKGTMIGIAVAVGVLAGAVALLSFIEPSKLAPAVLSISIVMAMFALLEKSAKGLKKSMGAVIALTAAVAAIGTVLYLLAGLPYQQSLAASASLSMVLLAMVAALKVMDTIKSVSATAIVAVAVLGAVAAGIGLIINQMKELSPESAIANAASLSMLLLIMTASLAVLSNIKSVSPVALVGMAALTVIVGLLGGVLGILQALDIQPSIETAASLSTLLLAMSAVTAILTVVGAAAPAAIAGAVAMAGVIGVIAAIVLAAGAIKQIPGAEWLATEGGAFLQQIGSAIGGFVGSMIGSGLETASESLPQVGTNLSNFINNLKPFLDGISGIDESKVTAVSSIGAMILAITGAGILEGIKKFLGGGDSLSEFGAQLVPFGQSMKAYSDSIAGIDASAVTASATAAKALAELNNSLPSIGGVVGFFAGNKVDLGTFGSQITAFGEGLKSYAASVAGIDASSIQSSAQAAQGLADLQNSLGEDGGVIDFFAGEDVDLGTFGANLEQFGAYLSSYAWKVSGIPIDGISSSVTAAQSLANFAGTDLTSSLQLPSFGAAIEWFGAYLSSYYNKTSYIDPGIMTSVVSGVNPLISMAQTSSGIDYGGLSNFGFNLEWFGAYLSSYYNKTSYIDPGIISTTVSSVNQLVDMCRGMQGLDASVMATFGSSLEQMGNTSIEGFVSAFYNAGPRVAAAATAMIMSMVSAVRGQIGMIQSTFSNLLMQAVNTINARRPIFTTSGVMLMQALNQGLRTGGNSLNGAFNQVLNQCVSSIQRYRGQFVSAGRYVAQGFADGIDDGAFAARIKAAAMAKAALEAAKQAIGVQSPSREFMKVGRFVAEGLSIGIDNYARMAVNSSEDMAKSALGSAEDTISGLAKACTSAIEGRYSEFYNAGSTIVQGISDAIQNGKELAQNATNNLVSGINPTFTEKIKPILDSNSIYSQYKRLDLSGAKIGANFDLSFMNGNIQSLGNIVRESNEQVMNSNAKVIEAISSLKDDISSLSSAIFSDNKEVSLYVDSKKLASSIAKPMNRQLNVLSKRGAL